ncbi:nuclease domain-containing protein [Marinobacter sp. UBA2678]|uniref:nuclease domain-containing protein n=1 Tax=Marinobacter sp. UBA2678 TaxID=1946815 RepID=UPI0026891516
MALADPDTTGTEMLTRKTPLKTKTSLKSKGGLKSRTRMKTSRPNRSKIRESAKGEPCLVRVPGVCNGNSDTTVLAHLNGGGIGWKNEDHKAAYACSACHGWLDGGYATQGYSRATRDLWHLEGVVRTQDRLIEKGHIEVKGAA